MLSPKSGMAAIHKRHWQSCAAISSVQPQLSTIVCSQVQLCFSWATVTQQQTGLYFHFGLRNEFYFYEVLVSAMHTIVLFVL